MIDAQVLLSILAHETSSDGISQSLRATPETYSLTLADGTGANQAQVAWSDSRTLAGSSETLDAASLTDDRGTVTMTALKAVYFKNASTAALTFTPTPAGAFGGTFHVRPDGAVLSVAPDAAGMAPGEMVVAGSAGQRYDVILIGEGTVT